MNSPTLIIRLVISIIGLACLAGFFLDATGDWVTSLLFFFGLICLELAFLLVFLIYIARSGGDWRSYRVRLILLGFLISLSVVGLLAPRHWPFRIRFFISKPFLDRFAHQVLESSDGKVAGRSGLFHVRGITRGEDWLAFGFSREVALMKNGLLVYARNPKQWTATTSLLLVPLADGWYLTAVDDAGLELLFPEIITGWENDSEAL